MLLFLRKKIFLPKDESTIPARFLNQFIINSPLWVWWCKPDGFHVDIDFLDKNLINWIRRKKMSTLAYTIIDQKQLEKTQRLELDGIIIDDPHLN